ncbi:HEAT repeat domain-containing protein [Rhodopirellula sp. MGV]|uniref:HEAT repeat domain-containing protein n=1 Tax=Rhodopirellula sp. MGV TaxID=2023130 RepID=UPI000B96249F|nr:HEAT repeat domain-containing protein [Rhodopirellula sp. MGV]OYP31668.1 hypothetical protein CGZ80_20880 [Rhodopirellula sp. MGV]PNY33971.1 HEAT repeat domain-containing protein [Rhodopirellula baltica]
MRTRPNKKRTLLQITLRSTALLLLAPAIGGCHDGPMYALKSVNPYFTMRAWKKDTALGVTDHERRGQIQALAGQIEDMPEEKQAFWAGHLERIMESDPSPEMRFHAVHAAAGIKSSDASLRLIEKGLSDESIKVQAASCQSLGVRKEPEAVQLLAKTLNSTTELDVKHSAIAALKNHQGTIPVDSLRLILEDQDPATVYLAMDSLRGVMKEDHGNDPKEWIAAIDATRTPATPGGVTDGLRFAEKDARELK